MVTDGAPSARSAGLRRTPGSSRYVKRVLWDVDTQVDFIEVGGKLAVPHADATVPAMARLVDWARREGIPHVASADDHELTDAEISESPDYADTFPPHCLRGTRGAEKIPQTVQLDPVPLGLTEVPDRWLRGREFLLLKKSFGCSRANAERVLDLLAPDEVVLFRSRPTSATTRRQRPARAGAQRHLCGGCGVRHRRRAIEGLRRLVARRGRSHRNRR